MNKALCIATLFVLLVACTPIPTSISSSPIPNLGAQDTDSASPVPQSAAPTASVETTPASAATPQPAASLSLQVTSPLDEAVVNTAQIDVIGSAPAGTVVSVNDEIILVVDDQQFKTTVALDEGLNQIEVVASDVDGNESSLLLTITYEP